MNFTENLAYLGGAIYAFSMPVVFANYLRNRLCIIQYNDTEQEDVPVENWKVCSCPFCAFMHRPICSCHILFTVKFTLLPYPFVCRM